MNVEEMIADIMELRETARRTNVLAQEKSQLLAEFLCPFSVDDRVINGDGEEEIIDSIYSNGLPSKYCSGYRFKVKKIKKNGEPYSNPTSVWNQDKYTKK
jgi:hypothetical protein